MKMEHNKRVRIFAYSHIRIFLLYAYTHICRTPTNYVLLSCDVIIIVVFVCLNLVWPLNGVEGVTGPISECVSYTLAQMCHTASVNNVQHKYSCSKNVCLPVTLIFRTPFVLILLRLVSFLAVCCCGRRMK